MVHNTSSAAISQITTIYFDYFINFISKLHNQITDPEIYNQILNESQLYKYLIDFFFINFN